MAQKTPVPALTIDTSGTWTSLWYYEFSELQSQWTANLQLHYVVNAYFASKRRLMHNLTILQNNQTLHINAQMVAVEQLSSSPNRQRKRPVVTTTDTKSLSSSSLLVKASQATTTNLAYSALRQVWSMTVQKTFHRLRAGRYNLFTVNPQVKSLIPLRQLQKHRVRAGFTNYFSTKKFRRFASQRYCYRWLARAAIMITNSYNNILGHTLPAVSIRRRASSLQRPRAWRSYRVTARPQSQGKATTKNQQRFLTTNAVNVHKSFSGRRILQAAQQFQHLQNQGQTAQSFKSLRRQKQLMYNLATNTDAEVAVLRVTPLVQPKVVVSSLSGLNDGANQMDLYYTSQAIAVKPTTVLEHQIKTLTPTLPRALYRRWRRDRQAFSRLRPRKNRPFMLAYRLLMARRGRSLTYKKRYARRFLKLSLLKVACQHIAGFPVNLTVRRYVCRTRYFKHLRHRAVFSRWARQWYFLPTVVLVLTSLMRGSTALLMVWLLRLLKSAKKHSAILYLISTAFKYFLYQPNTAHLVTNLPCCGVRLEVIGKIDGQDRAQTFKVQVGAIPTSTLSAPLDVEYGACGTIYGVLGVWLWLFMKPQAIQSQTLLMRNPTYLVSQSRQKAPKVI